MKQQNKREIEEKKLREKNKTIERTKNSPVEIEENGRREQLHGGQQSGRLRLW
jgi:hypothetical protein